MIADEVYAALSFGKPHVSIGGLPGMGERTVTINSLSKSGDDRLAHRLDRGAEGADRVRP